MTSRTRIGYWAVRGGAGIVAWLATTPASATTYTLDAEFDTGVLSSVNHEAPGSNQLQLSASSNPEPFMWVAQTNNGIILKLDTRTGRQVGRYPSTRTADCASCPAAQAPHGTSGLWSPSRTAVDLNGDVWVANRSFGVQGSITKLGSTASSCVDRNESGTIETSSDANNDGIVNQNDPAEYFGQADECLVKSIAVGAPDAVLRAIALDAAGNLWVGSYNFRQAYKVDPNTGLTTQTINLGTTPYGFVLKGDHLYAAALGSPVARANVVSGNVQRMGCGGNYGITVNSAGVAWFGNYEGGILKADFDAPASGCPVSGSCATSCQSFAGDAHYGITVDAEDQIWAGGPSNNRVQKYSPAGVLLGSAPVPNGVQPYGVAVGHDGKIWTSGFFGIGSIEPGPVGGPPGATADFDQNFPGSGDIFNYTYSDFTGFQLRNITIQQGTWSVVKDGGTAATVWGTVSWNAEPQGAEPAGTSITGEARASDVQADLASEPWLAVANGALFNLVGRFIEVRMTLKNNDTQVNQTPVLSDVTIKTANTAPNAQCTDRAICTSPGLCVGVTDVNNGSSDPDGDPLTLLATPASPYPLGTTAVTLNVSDGKGGADSCQASVLVNDCQPPAISCIGAQTVECTDGNSATVSVSASASDNCGAVAATCNQPSGSFPLGTTAVTCSATDAANLTSTCATSVTVADTTPPIISGALSAGAMWPPHHKHRVISLADCGIAVRDSCGGPLTLAAAGAEITCVSSDEPANSTGDGNTLADIVIVNGTTVKLLPERAGDHDGRVYSIGFKVKDGSGNQMTGTCKVTVPHSQNGTAAVDSGAKYTVCR